MKRRYEETWRVRYIEREKETGRYIGNDMESERR